MTAPRPALLVRPAPRDLVLLRAVSRQFITPARSWSHSTISNKLQLKRKYEYAISYRHKQESMISINTHERWGRRQRHSSSRSSILHQITLILSAFLLMLTIVEASLEADRNIAPHDEFQNNDNGLHQQDSLIDVKEPFRTGASSTQSTGTTGDQDDDVNVYFRRTQTAISSVQVFTVKLAFRMLYLDKATADVLSKGRQSDPIVHRLCSAVNLQVS